MTAKSRTSPSAVIPDGRALRGRSGIHEATGRYRRTTAAAGGSRITRLADEIGDLGQTGVRDDDVKACMTGAGTDR